MQNFLGKYLKISQKLNGGGRKHIMVFKKQKSQNQEMNIIFYPMPTSIVHIFKNSVRLVPCFVGVHHIFSKTLTYCD